MLDDWFKGDGGLALMSKKLIADDSFIDYLISSRSFLSKTEISEDHRAVFYELHLYL